MIDDKLIQSLNEQILCNVNQSEAVFDTEIDDDGNIWTDANKAGILIMISELSQAYEQYDELKKEKTPIYSFEHNGVYKGVLRWGGIMCIDKRRVETEQKKESYTQKLLQGCFDSSITGVLVFLLFLLVVGFVSFIRWFL